MQSAFRCIIVHFTVACLVAKPLKRGVKARGLVMIKTLLLNHFVIMLTRYRSLSQHGHLQSPPYQRLGNYVHNYIMAYSNKEGLSNLSPLLIHQGSIFQTVQHPCELQQISQYDHSEISSGIYL